MTEQPGEKSTMFLVRLHTSTEVSDEELIRVLKHAFEKEPVKITLAEVATGEIEKRIKWLGGIIKNADVHQIMSGAINELVCEKHALEWTLGDHEYGEGERPE